MSQLEEAKRIKRIAVSRYRPGQYIRATFKGDFQKMDVYYFNPRDIPLKIPYELYLYTVWEAKK